MARPRKTAKTAAARPQYRAPALEKGLDIIELLADQSDGLTQGEIAAALKRSVSEIFRMLTCLQERGYVTLHKPADVYTLTLKLFELSHRHPPMRRLINEALPLMTNIVRRIDQSCHLSVCHEDRMLVVAQVDNPGSIGFSVRMGAQLDLLRTASGLVILAFQTDEERKRILSEQITPSRQSPAFEDLESRFKQIRKRGYEESDSQQVQGVRNLSFPVLDFTGKAVAALAVPYLRRIDRTAPKIDDAREALREAAQKLSAAIGARLA
ncbi:MAG: IclR family transcriptional regulator [Proteobacteria bacterium]|jgi:DNA-binding IclR family transcriptional regulator|nr:MAG: IclR family transcriptional regulator [Pseudomonadota bacterium]